MNDLTVILALHSQLMQ